MIVNVLALVVIALVATFGAMQRLWRSAVGLVALVLGGAAAAVLGPPLADLLAGAGGDVWAHTAEALAFWAVLCLGFLGLRTAAHRFLPNEPPLPAVAQAAGGAAVGAVTGYLAAGLCLVIVQMLPVAPSVLGYEPFRYVQGASPRNPERVERGDTLVLAPDRAALWLLDAVTGGALRARYGDTYPPARQRQDGDTPTRDADDVLYHHWYQRWQAVRWRTGRVAGPVAEVPPGDEGKRALALERARKTVLYGLALEVTFAVRSTSVPGFSDVVPPAGHEFLRVRVRVQPVADGTSPAPRLPRTIDTAQFRLVDTEGARAAGPPLVTGEARQAADGGGQPRTMGSAHPPEPDPRNLRFAFPGDGEWGAYAATGLRLTFTGADQYASRTLVFTVPSALPTESLRLYLDPQVPAKAEVVQETWPAAPAAET